MIRVRGFPISDADAAELARGLRAYSAASEDVAERVERALLMGTGVIGTDTLQARAVLSVLDEQAGERLQEVREELRRFVKIG